MFPRKQSLMFPELADELQILKPVNIASVPHRSPFRYPGGKTWFVPTFRQWVAQMHPKPKTLIEPFAGGGIISLTALFEDLAERAIMVELDENIAAVWETIVKGKAEWLADRIVSFELTKETIVETLRKTPKTQKEKAFQTILKNRTFHGGILAEGAGFIKNGENGKGICSRWYPETIAKRLLNLNHILKRIDFRCGDGLDVIQAYAPKQDVIYFIDPPYTAGGKRAGKRLYKHYDIDHEHLFTICESLEGDFLITYDNSDEVKSLAKKHGFQMRLIPMNNTHHATLEELVIGKDLSWMDLNLSVHHP